MRQSSADPGVKNLQDFVFDQFDIGNLRVLAYETFNPTGDL